MYFSGSNFGLLAFDFTQNDPALTITLHDVQGNSVWSPLVLRASELNNGVSVWRDKMDKISRQRFERTEQGKPYYGPGG